MPSHRERYVGPQSCHNDQLFKIVHKVKSLKLKSCHYSKPCKLTLSNHNEVTESQLPSDACVEIGFKQCKSILVLILQI